MRAQIFDLAVSQNQSPIAKNDLISTNEDRAINFNVLSSNGQGADADPEGEPIAVVAINGLASNVGHGISLASGAVVLANPDGRFVDDPNGAFDSLNVGQKSNDSFSYTVSDAHGHTASATVTITVSGAQVGVQINGGDNGETHGGTSADDQIFGGAGNDTLSGGAGFDWLQGKSGDDSLDGGDDSDFLDGGDGNDTLIGGTGDDIVDGGSGTNTASYAAASSGVIVDLGAGNASGGAGNDVLLNVANVVGSAKADILVGDDHANTIAGGLGNDVLSGGGGADVFIYNGGNDAITDFVPGNTGDTVSLAALTGFHTLVGLLSHAAQVGPDAVFDFGSTGKLTLQNVALNALTEKNFVLPPNHAPTAVAISGSTIAENSTTGTVIGSFTTTDPDTGETFTYSLQDSAGGWFAVSGSKLTVAGGLDFEQATSHQIIVRVTDIAGNTFDKQLSIKLTNVNEAPAITSNVGGDTASISVQENSTAITVVEATDPDAGATLTYSIAGGVDASRFQINSEDRSIEFQVRTGF